MTMGGLCPLFLQNTAVSAFGKDLSTMGFLTKLFGTNMAKEIKRIDPIVRKIEALEEEYKGLTDAQLQAKTAEFKERYQKGETLDDLLPEAFATCRGGRGPGSGASPLPGAAHRRRHSPPGPHRRDEDRRGQDPGGHPPRLPQRPVRGRGSTSSPSTTTWPSATATGWEKFTAFWASPWAW